MRDKAEISTTACEQLPPKRNPFLEGLVSGPRCCIAHPSLLRRHQWLAHSCPKLVFSPLLQLVRCIPAKSDYRAHPGILQPQLACCALSCNCLAFQLAALLCSPTLLNFQLLFTIHRHTRNGHLVTAALMGAVGEAQPTQPFHWERLVESRNASRTSGTQSRWSPGCRSHGVCG